jgi:hypothetical protein
MGTGGSKKSKSLPPSQHRPTFEPHHGIAPPAFQPAPDLDLYPAFTATDPYSMEIPQPYVPPTFAHTSSTQHYQPSPPALQSFHSVPTVPPSHHTVKEEEAPSILLDDNAPIPRLPSDPRPESGTGIFTLDSDTLNGQWLYLPDECEIEMEPVMSLCIERAYVRGLSVANFKFEGSPCSVSFRDMSFTVNGASGVSVYPLVRKQRSQEKLFWQGDDQVLRPFIPAVEALILTHKDVDVVFQMDNDVLNVNFSAGIVKEPASGAEHLLQLVESSS